MRCAIRARTRNRIRSSGAEGRAARRATPRPAPRPRRHVARATATAAASLHRADARRPLGLDPRKDTRCSSAPPDRVRDAIDEEVVALASIDAKGVAGVKTSRCAGRSSGGSLGIAEVAVVHGRGRSVRAISAPTVPGSTRSQCLIKRATIRTSTPLRGRPPQVPDRRRWFGPETSGVEISVMLKTV